MSGKLRGKYQEVNEHQTALNIIKREMELDKIALSSFIFIVAIIILVFAASFVIDQTDALRFDLGMVNLAPSINHIFGTDNFGRDGFLMLIVAARNTLTITVLVTLISSAFGVIYGLISGYVGGRIDNFMMRIVDGMSILPNVVIMIAFVAIIGRFSLFTFTVLMSLLTWTAPAKMVRAKLIQEKELEYIQASLTLGTSHFKIITNQLLPNLSTIIIASIVVNAVGIIGIEAGISFIGFGFPPEMPSLGTLVSEARRVHVMTNRWWSWVPATSLIVLILFSINNIGNMLNRATDARQRRG